MIYAKVNRKVAEYLGVATTRYNLPDGNVYLWQCDILRLGMLDDLDAILKRIGGVAMSPYDVCLEQQGKIYVELPEPEDEMFKEGGES